MQRQCKSPWIHFNSLVFPGLNVSLGPECRNTEYEARTMLQSQTHSTTVVLEPSRANAREQWEQSVSAVENSRPQGQNRDILYAELQPLVRRLISQYGDDAESRKDLAGEIYCRFCTILESFDESRGIPLRPYLI